ncbi:MAG: hypothetical protein KF745_13620 [Phycisphaeraceae bacterium]|nr:hypothetical protein [Phycisphaeraceae bacterium]
MRTILRTAICRAAICGVVAGVWCSAAAAQQPTVDLSKLPAEIKTLTWQTVDLSTVSELERIRALMFTNDVLDELGAQTVTEADLMSGYIQASGLGEAFAGFKAVPDPAPLTMDNALQISVALLRGPMAGSSYATALADVPKDELGAYLQLYTSSCQRQWATMGDNRLRVRAMSQFLEAKGKVSDYQAWVPGELKLQAEQQKAAEAQQAAALAAKEAQQQEKQIQEQKQQLQQQAQQQQEAMQQMQQSMCAAQQHLTAAQQAQANATAMAENTVYPNWYYGGLGYAALPWYYHNWYHNGAYLGAAQARTDARFSGWHGGGGFRR